MVRTDCPRVQKHWLYGDYREVKIVKESECKKCIHRRVCGLDMEKRCVNYRMGTSEGAGTCQSCLNRYGRWDSTQWVPCFKCREFKRK